jgi:hypothetical protein
MRKASHVEGASASPVSTRGPRLPIMDAPTDKSLSAAPSATPSVTGPLDANDLALLEQAGERRRKLGHALRLARLNGWTLLLCALPCLPFALLDPALLPVGLALLAIGAAELRGARWLRQLDQRAPRWLGYNQLVLLALIGVYCGIGVYHGLHASSPTVDLARDYPDLAAHLPELGDDLGAGKGPDLLSGAYKAAMVGFYLALFAACALYQGCCAYFYFTRAPLLRAHREQTPPWVLQVQRRLLGW